MEPEGMEGYLSNLSRVKVYPKDQYTHQFALIDSEQSPDEELGGFSDIVDKYVQTSDISSDTLMFFFSTEVDILTHLRDMARRERELIPLYKTLKNKFRNQMLLYKASKGNERKHQSAASKPSLPQPVYGYGNEMYEQPQVKDEQKGGLLSRFLKNNGGQ